MPCRVSHWSPWAACTNDVEVASRTITQAGADCLPLKRSRACVSKPAVQTFRDAAIEEEDDEELLVRSVAPTGAASGSILLL